jgi:hypothetical protein
MQFKIYDTDKVKAALEKVRGLPSTTRTKAEHYNKAVALRAMFENYIKPLNPYITYPYYDEYIQAGIWGHKTTTKWRMDNYYKTCIRNIIQTLKSMFKIEDDAQAGRTVIIPGKEYLGYVDRERAISFYGWRPENG